MRIQTHYRRIRLSVGWISILALSSCLVNSGLFATVPDVRIRQVSMEEILAAMRTQTGYDATATTNVARFQAEVLLELVRSQLRCNKDHRLLSIGHAEWFAAYLEFTGLTETSAPIFARLANSYRQNQMIEYNMENVIRRVSKGSLPKLALNVKVAWPESPGVPTQYSFEDTLATPNLKVTNHRVITYRILDFGDMIVYDEIEGLTGRPTSGILAMLFKLIGEGRVLQSRIMVSEDGLQINRTRAKKGPFAVAATLTVQPNGVTQKGLPPQRPELQALESRLREPLNINYMPFNF